MKRSPDRCGAVQAGRRRPRVRGVSSGVSLGVSLVEALVALAVMGFGMVGLVGIQSTLRANADVARHRAEAVRLGQERSELARAYSAMGITPGQRAYDDLVTAPPESILPAGASNTAYTLTQTVTDTASPRRKTLLIDVAWQDRTGQPQAVRLASVVSGTPPELAAALSVPTDGSPMGRPLGRHAGIPRDAVPVAGTQTSRLDLSALGGAPGSAWVFDNASGAVTQVCTLSGCTPYLGRLLTGFVRFSTEAVTPTDAGLNPGGLVGSGTPALGMLGVAVQQTAPVVGNLACLQRVDPAVPALEYFCAVPVTSTGVPPPPPSWSGRSRVTGLGSAVASAPGDPAADRFRVCRYTPVRAHTPVPPLRNIDHPRDYVGVNEPLTNQNFLVIRAGNGTAANACPGTAGQPGNTFDHQPDV